MTPAEITSKLHALHQWAIVQNSRRFDNPNAIDVWGEGEELLRAAILKFGDAIEMPAPTEEAARLDAIRSAQDAARKEVAL